MNESRIEERLHAAYAACEDLVGVDLPAVLEIGRHRRLRRRVADGLAATVVAAAAVLGVLGVHALVDTHSNPVPGGAPSSPTLAHPTPTTWSGPSMSIDGQRYVIQLRRLDARTPLAHFYRLDSGGQLADLGGGGSSVPLTDSNPMWGAGNSLVPNLTYGVFAEGSHDFTCALASGKPYPCKVATMPVTLDGHRFVAMVMTLPTGEDIKSFLGKVSWTDSAATRHTTP